MCVESVRTVAHHFSHLILGIGWIFGSLDRIYEKTNLINIHCVGFEVLIKGYLLFLLFSSIMLLLQTLLMLLTVSESIGVQTRQAEFKIKFKKSASSTQGKLNARVPGDENLTPADQLREWHQRSKDSASSSTEKDDELSYKVMQTIKGSYAAIGPLQCESTCHVKRARPHCHVDTLDCALGCAERCEQGTNEVELKEKLCIEGCTLFCGVHPTMNAGGFAPPGVHKV
jgi:hypothetical protein